MKKSILLLISFLCVGIYAQEKTPFTTYWKVGLETGFNYYFIKNQNNPLGQTLNNPTYTPIGLQWNAYQFDSYNLKVGVRLHLGLGKSNHKTFGKNQAFYYEKTTINQSQVSIPIQLERYFPSGKNYWVAGIGIDNTYTHNFGDSKSSYTLTNGKQIDVTSQGNKYNPVFLLNAGYGLASDIGLFELKVNGGLGLTTPVKFTYTEQGSSTNMVNSFSNSYIGIGLTFYPKR